MVIFRGYILYYIILYYIILYYIILYYIIIYIYTLRTKTHRNLRVWKIPELFWQNPGYFNPFWKYGLGTGSKSIPEVFNRKPRFSFFSEIPQLLVLTRKILRVLVLQVYILCYTVISKWFYDNSDGENDDEPWFRGSTILSDTLTV